MSARRWIGAAAAAALLVAVALWRVSVSSTPADAPGGAARKPVRIASLTLGTDEILSELVSPERVVCVTSLADDREISNVAHFYPAHISRLRDSDPERIIGLNPDLVCVAPYNSADFLKVMERSGLPVFRNEAVDGMDPIEAAILDIGKRVGEEDRAQELVARMRGRRQRLAAQLQGITRRPRVLFWSAGFTAGTQTTIDDIIRAAGGVNVAAERKLTGSAAISPEQVIAADPDYILLSQWTADAREGRIENHPLLRNLRAVQEKRVLSIEARYLTAVSQFVVDGAERLAAQLHPDRCGSRPAEGAP
jgi:iron complex transport system substrate-binding protein